MEEILFKIRYSERGLSTSLKKGNIFFQTQFLQMGGIIKNKRGLELQKSRSFRLQNKFKNIPLSVIYYLTKFNDPVRRAGSPK